MLHRFIQSANDGTTHAARSNLTPPKSRSHSNRYLMSPRSGVTIVSLSLGHGVDVLGVADGNAVSCEVLLVLVEVSDVDDAVADGTGTVIVIRPVSFGFEADEMHDVRLKLIQIPELSLTCSVNRWL